MRRGDLVLYLAFASLVAACGGGDDSSTPDAVLVHIDASPPDSPPPPDAFVCTLTMCGADCVDTDTDPEHCGSCDNACQSGAQCNAPDCVCPPGFLPASLSGNPTGQDMVIGGIVPGATAALTPFFAAEIDAFGVGYPDTGIALNTNFPLDATTLPDAPFAIALFNIDIGTMMPESGWAAVSGTVRFTKACGTGASGTITNATFQAAQIFPTPMVDPAGCTFDVPTLAFSIADPASCPPP